MNAKIAEILKDEISSLAWIEKIAGLVKPVTYKDKSGEEKTMPVYTSDTDLCHISHYEDFCPDSKKKSIVYFEDQGMDVLNAGCNYIDIETNLRIVCWCNLKLINPEYSDAILLKLDIIKNITQNPANNDWVTKIDVQFEGEETKSPDIFSDYTYDEQKQFLMYPYDYFALNYKVRYSVPVNECFDDIVISPDICA